MKSQQNDGVVTSADARNVRKPWLILEKYVNLRALMQ